MRTLKVLLGASPLFYVNPLWVSWGSRVEAFRESFAATPNGAFRNIGSAVTDFPRAFVYLAAPDHVTESQARDILRVQWNDRTPGVDVTSVEITAGVAQQSTDLATLRSLTPSGKVQDALGNLVGDAGRWALIAVVVLAAAYGLGKGIGTREWS